MTDSLRKSYVNNSISYPSKDDIEYAKIVARRMFEMYDKDQNRNIDNYEISPMIEDAYKAYNKTYNPTNDDVNGYAKILDVNHDGKVSLSDLETLCIKYLVGDNGLTLHNSPSTAFKSNIEESTKKSSPGYLGSSYYSPGSLRESSPIVQRGTKPYEFGSVSPYRKAESRVLDYGIGASPYRTAEREKRAGAGIPVESSLRSSVHVEKTRIEQIRRVFDKYDLNKDGFIDEFELKKLMEETYKFLGVAKVITHGDVQSYLAMVDTNRDGKISYPEYENIVVKCLAKNNVKFS